MGSSALVDMPISQCGHYHTKCIAPGVDTHEDYTLYSYPINVNVELVWDQVRDLAFAGFYNGIVQKKIREFIAAGMTKPQARAQMTALQNNPAINASLTASAYAISIDGVKLKNHGCWCSKGNSNIGRKTGGRPTDIVDYICKKYIERQECLSMRGGACENYTLVKSIDPSQWYLESPSGEQYREYWAKVWLGPDFLIPEQAVYIEDNVDPCMKEKAKPAYEFIQQFMQVVRGGYTEEGQIRVFQGLNPFQTNWDGWKPDAVCGDEREPVDRIFHRKKCVGYSPHVFAVWDDEV